MRTEQSVPIRLEDYRPPDWLVETVDLDVSLDRDRDAGARGVAPEAQSEGRGPRPAGPRRRRPQAGLADARRRSARARPLCRHARQPHHRAAAATAVHARDRDRPRSVRQHPAHGPLSLGHDLLHPMRGRGLPPHHLLSRPPRRDGGVHHPHRGGQGRMSGAARQRQSRRVRRRAGHQAAFRGLARSVPEAVLSVRAGRRRPRATSRTLPHHVGPRRRAAHLCRARQRGAQRLRHGRAQALHALGRGAVRARIRPRHLHGRRGLDLQHGRDGEQGAQRLQRQIRAGLDRHRDRPATTWASRR